jgi:hypothetical protein
MRKIYSLLIAWCVLLLTPGVVELLGRIRTSTSLPGYWTLVWIVGYLAQFCVFMWIMNLVGEQKVLWWFIASLLPWAVDWTVPVLPWFLLLWMAVVVAVAAWIVQFTRRARSLQQGVRATGVVLEVLKPWMERRHQQRLHPAPPPPAYPARRWIASLRRHFEGTVHARRNPVPRRPPRSSR